MALRKTVENLEEIVIRVLAVLRDAVRETIATLRWIGYILKEAFEETKKRWGK